jgi:hypothetical protein
MVATVSGPNTLGFLHWLKITQPSITSVEELSEHAIYKLPNDSARSHLSRAYPTPFLDDTTPQVRSALITLAEHYLSENSNPIGIYPDELVESVLRPFRAIRYREFARGERVDSIRRYRTVPFNGILLYGTDDSLFHEWFFESIEAISEEAGSIVDLYEYGFRSYGKLTLRQRKKLFTYSEEYIQSLYPIPGADPKNIIRVGLPCILVWTDNDHALVPLSDALSSSISFTLRLREVLRFLAEDDIRGLARRFFNRFEPDSQESPVDIFLSYRHSDRHWVDSLTKKLEQNSFSVWFDKNIHVGDRFDLKILWHIENAKAVIVVWTSDSRQSQWVKAEAAFALDAQKLAPVFPNGVIKLPPPFNVIHGQDLRDWDFSDRHPGFLSLCETAAQMRSRFEADRKPEGK